MSDQDLVQSFESRSRIEGSAFEFPHHNLPENDVRYVGLPAMTSHVVPMEQTPMCLEKRFQTKRIIRA